jgi:hypothetical protein
MAIETATKGALPGGGGGVGGGASPPRGPARGQRLAAAGPRRNGRVSQPATPSDGPRAVRRPVR